jgi:uncharacterized protein YjbI with pentapeptide repeats
MPTTVKQLYVTREEILAFSTLLQAQRTQHPKSEALNLNSFIMEQRGLSNSESIIHQANLDQIALHDDDCIDLRGADISFIRFCDDDTKKTFKRKQWQLDGFYDGQDKLKQVTNLQGAVTPPGCIFKGFSFAGCDWGKRTLNSEQFPMCSFKGSVYDPSLPQVMVVKVGIKELQNYIKLRNKHPVHASAIGSFSDYISYTKRHLCSENTKIVADLSGQIIDGTKISIDGVDLSGTLLDKTIFKNVTADNFIMRDCGIATPIFKNCRINNIDLRGTYANKMTFAEGTAFAAAIISAAIAPIGFPCAKPTLDPCYIRGQSSLKLVDGKVVRHDPTVGKYYKCTIADIKEYAEQCQQSEGVLTGVITSATSVESSLPSFRDFLRNKYKLKEEFIPDASGLVLDRLNLSYGNWGRCNWSRCSMVETVWDYSNIGYSNFGHTIFNGNIPAWGMGWFEREYKTSFRNTILTGSNFDNAQGRCAIFSKSSMDGVSAIDGDFTEGVFNEASVRDGNFSYSYMTLVQAIGMDATNSIMQNVHFMYAEALRAIFNGSRVDGTSFDYSNMQEVKMRYASAVGTSFYAVDATGMDCTGTKLWANITRMKMAGMTLEHTDVTEAIEAAGRLFGRWEAELDASTNCSHMISSDKAFDLQRRSAEERQHQQTIGHSAFRQKLFTFAKAADYLCGTKVFSKTVEALCSLADHKLVTAACMVITPIVALALTNGALNYAVGTGATLVLMSGLAVPLTITGIAAGTAVAVWATGAGKDSEEVRLAKAAQVQFRALHPANETLLAHQAGTTIWNDIGQTKLAQVVTRAIHPSKDRQTTEVLAPERKVEIPSEIRHKLPAGLDVRDAGTEIGSVRPLPTPRGAMSRQPRRNASKAG